MANHLSKNEEDDITFNEQNNDAFSSTVNVGNMNATARDALAEIRREASDIYNRLHSIAEDTIFVEIVAKAYPHLPLLPNLRCGAWYINPDTATAVPAYFKSTDGHFSNWSFNLRRPHLHLLPLISDRKGIVLVDSTRAGKKIPDVLTDALSKTVPIWCAVANRAIRKNTRLDPSQPTLVLQTEAGEKGRHHFLSTILPQSIAFIQTRLFNDQHVCVTCDSGNNVAAGIVLVALQLFFDENGVYGGEKKGRVGDKKSLHTRLEWMISDRPEVNPSRSTLKRINEFLLTPQRGD